MPESQPRRIPTISIEPNPENPRLFFDPKSLDELKESIRKVGILVPLIVYKNGKEKEYVLLDGERRYKCAVSLDLPEVPVNIIAKPNRLENILRMFSIHTVREQWSLIETALKIEQITKITGDDRENTLVDLTGLKPSQIRRYKQILRLPKKGKDLMLTFVQSDKDRKGKASLMEEMLPVLRIVERDYPLLWKKYEQGYELIDAFIDKYEKGTIANVTDFRMLRKTLISPKKGANADSIAAQFEKYIQSESLTIKDLYETTAKTVYDRSGILRELNKLDEILTQIATSDWPGEEKATMVEMLAKLESRIANVRASIGGR